MTRGLQPPDSLSKEDVYVLREVRKDIYTQGMVGGGLGACAGLVMYTGAQHMKKRLGYFKNAPFNRNTAMLVVFSSFAFGTFLFSSTTGKEEVHKLHPVFRAGAGNGGGEGDSDGEDLTQRLKSNRMTRRKTVMDTIQRGRGFSDAHSGRWVENENENIELLKTNRMTRRKTVMDTIQRGRGFSDAHSGQWVEEESETTFRKES
eukprot:CAMPEP_0113452496 /NCGR_PEP_ID=MMETSP0014_2-20120614/6876_1 /TAXON_ID=2857 /ORGANISM="Nitzschia sp." /LENGTH=203 /DNA_ID=CAMNT_0000343869 /DNA_START=981 /DNA_END=1592 /DNA_ORIENTATION=- /assembly_acc=CAM_ASM_000159